MDQRIEKLAHTLVNYSIKAQKGEKVLIEGRGTYTLPLVQAIIRECHKAGALPLADIYDPILVREIILGDNEELFKLKDEVALQRMEQMDCYIGIGSPENVNELADIPADLMSKYNKLSQKAFKRRVEHTRWVVLRFPNPAMAQLANKSTMGFEDFYYNVCNLDYSKMDEAMKHLQNLMERTDKVHIVGPNTDLSFSIKGMPAIRCAGELNIPDGEVYTAPIKDSVNGRLCYNTPSNYMGFTFNNICLQFKDGKIIDATSNDTARINTIFDTDEGARYIGEFAIGVNPYIDHPMLETLFDEKIKGSFHFTPGSSYDNAYNGNKSAVHWDLVCIQREDYGGGEMYFDDVLVRKDGLFVLDELKALNPEQLI